MGFLWLKVIKASTLADTFLSFGGGVSISWADDVVQTSTPKQLLLQSPWNTQHRGKKLKESNLGPAATLQDCITLGGYGVAILIEPPLCFQRGMRLFHRKGKLFLSYQWSVVIWAAGVTWQPRTPVSFTPPWIKLHWEGQHRVNPRLIQVEREPRRLPGPTPAQSRSKSRMLSAVSILSPKYLQGYMDPTTCGQPKIMFI